MSKRVEKPWGRYDQYAPNVRVLGIGPGHATSLQSHRKRREVWVALEEGLNIQIGRRMHTSVIGREYNIPKRTKHRLMNHTCRYGRVLEVSFGDFDEDDIERYEDQYGRPCMPGLDKKTRY